MSDFITILPFDAQKNLDALKANLRQLPYQIRVVSLDEWLQASGSDLGCAVAVFLTGEEAPKQEICKRFDELGIIPKLCIVADTSAFKQRWIIDRCNDVIGWPCSGEELSYRFCRLLGNTLQPGFGNAPNLELSEEFVKMNLIGRSSKFLQALSFIQKAIKHDVAVLVLGETGTGKELAARAIHYMGSRAEKPFIPVNCGALPQEIFENEVFGHEQGAFTDARKSQLGLVGQAQGGTLFLDEIDALSLKSQVVLLRFLQDHHYRPLGAQGYKSANVRIIAATNADITQLVKSGQFRADLLFRLNVLQINLPALRERLEDLPLLTEHLLRRFRTEYGGAKRRLSAVSYSWMRHYSWPGNVRELENVLLMAFLETDEQTIQLPHLEHQNRENDYVDIAGINWDASFNEAKHLVMGIFEKKYLTHILARTDGNITSAARLAGKERRALGRLIKKHGLKET